MPETRSLPRPPFDVRGVGVVGAVRAYSCGKPTPESACFFTDIDRVGGTPKKALAAPRRTFLIPLVPRAIRPPNPLQVVSRCTAAHKRRQVAGRLETNR